ESIDCNDTHWIPLDHAEVTTSGTRFPDTGRYRCNAGYKATVSSAAGKARCDRDGQWVASAYWGRLPDCQVISCPEPPLVTGATYTPTGNYIYESNVVFTCDPGFVMTTGDDTLYCGGDGEWVGDTPTCTGCGFHCILDFILD
ncbi:hypothetical protein LSAT2_028566, partial [Lamellibrachia satsuma]